MDRRSFVKRAGAAGLSAAALATTAASSAEARAEETEPSGPVPAEPVVAFVRDAARGEVTVVSGSHETTYRDRALVSRLVKAAKKGVR